MGSALRQQRYQCLWRVYSGSAGELLPVLPVLESHTGGRPAQKIGPHLTFPLDRDQPPLLETVPSIQQPAGLLGYVNFIGETV